MKFSEIVDQASALLQRKQRITYRTLKREFDLDDETLEDLKCELIEGQQLAADEDGKVLVWIGERINGEKDKGINEERESEGARAKGRKGETGEDLGPRASDPGRWTPAHLAERIRAASLTEGERKTITALFADLKGSTALIEGLDPEEARAIIDPALQLMMDAVHRYDGYVAQALGDGIFALFGVPLAHEDHPQRALYAALRMQEEMRRYSDQVRLKHGVPLAMRVGVNTGEVVVRSIRKDDLHTDYVPVGHSTNLAARMEQMATPGSILITEYTRAYALCHQSGETSQLFPVLWGLQQFYTARSDYQKAWEYGEQMLSLAQRLQDRSLLLAAYRVLGEVSFGLGEFPAAKTYCEDSVALDDPQQRRAQTFVYGEEPAMGARTYLSQDLFLLGYPDRALQAVREVLTVARELAHANSLAAVAVNIAWVHAHRREPDEAREYAEAVVSLATEQGLPFWSAWGTMVRGWALGAQGDSEAGIAEIRQGLTAYRTTGATQLLTYPLALLAEAYGKVGQAEDGLAALAEALTEVDKSGERFYEAELYRLRGELTLQQANQKAKVKRQKSKIETDPRPLTPDPQGEAEACFLKAIEVAQKQQAKSLELRAATSLARLWQSQSKRAEAHQMLAEIYGWFTEGFETKDLQEARGLLAELA